MKGSYVLVVELDREKDILIGRLGYIYFSRGFYAYTGSAMNGFKARLAHHLNDNKKPHWHIDYLLKEAELMEIILCPSEPFAICRSEGEKRPKNPAQGRLRAKCFLAQTLTKEFPSIPGFGASDCECNSHLHFANGKDRLTSRLVEAVDQAGLSFKIFSKEEMEFGWI